MNIQGQGNRTDFMVGQALIIRSNRNRCHLQWVRPDMAREDNPRRSSPRITSEARRIHEARMICHPRRGILDISRPVKMSWFRGRGWVMIPVSRTRMTLPSPRLVNLDIYNVYLTSRHVTLGSKPMTY